MNEHFNDSIIYLLTGIFGVFHESVDKQILNKGSISEGIST